MELLLLVSFIGINSFIVLLLTHAPIFKQSLLLGLSGAVVGCMLALVLRKGLNEQAAEVILILLVVESLLFFTISRLSSVRNAGI